MTSLSLLPDTQSWPKELCHTFIAAYHQYKDVKKQWCLIRNTINNGTKYHKTEAACRAFYYQHPQLFMEPNEVTMTTKRKIEETVSVSSAKKKKMCRVIVPDTAAEKYKLQSPQHNIFLTVMNNTGTRSVWIHCHDPKCMKWRQLPFTMNLFFSSLPKVCPVNYVPKQEQIRLLPSTKDQLFDYRQIVNVEYCCNTVVWDLSHQSCRDRQTVLQDLELEWGVGWLPIRFFRTPERINFLIALTNYMFYFNITDNYPWIQNRPVDLYALDNIIRYFGGQQKCDDENRWDEVYEMLKLPSLKFETCSGGDLIRKCAVGFFHEL